MMDNYNPRRDFLQMLAVLVFIGAPLFALVWAITPN